MAANPNPAGDVTQALFLGPGAIASLLCWQFQGQLTPRVFPHRPNLRLPTRLVDTDGEHGLAWTLPEPGLGFDAVDLVVVACKAGQVEAAVTPLLPAMPRAHWLILCNGLGPQQWLADQAPGRVLWGTTTEGARREAGGRVRRTGRGETLIGAPTAAAADAETRRFGDWLVATPGPLTLNWAADIDRRLWLKLAVNAVINPLTAAGGLPNGALAEPSWRGEIDALCAEIRAVAAACDQALPGDLAERVLAVARATASNHSSMRLDIEAGRPTEIEFINGFLLRRAFERELKTPRLLHWYRTLVSLDQPGR